MKKITILVPAYNEEEVLELFYQRVCNVIDDLAKRYNFELLFVNDGSKDRTLEVLKKLKNKDSRVSYIDLSRNYGKEIAMAAGFDYINSDAMIIIDADLQDPPELMIQMIDEWENGYDDVYAKRISRKGETYLKKMTSTIYYRILEKVSRVPIQKDTGDFRLLSKKAIESLKKFNESQRYTKGLFSLIGHKKKELLFERDPRAAGETKWNYIKLFGLAIDGITSFTTAPLKISIFIGILMSFLSFVYMTFIICKKIFLGIQVPGYPSLMSIILFIGGLQFLFLGVIGEYLGRIFLETKNRPLYFINEYKSGEDDEYTNN